ncbi:MAG: hypothetical protein EXS55_00505 [Candidatus Magasanikbacteria bacterium]|nr:hypothetical protein [Candidatus Magasanikbacteria bacterium]
MKTRTALFSLAALLFLGAGCASAPTAPSSTAVPTAPATPSPTAGPAEDPVEVATQKMVDSMKNNPSASNVPTARVTADKNFTGAVARAGKFTRLNYMTDGNASLMIKDGKNYVVLGDDFKTPNGPDLQIYLTKNTAPSSRADIKAGLNLGKLKSITGQQTYELPANLTLTDYNAITIHCEAFNVPWSWAPLQ